MNIDLLRSELIKKGLLKEIVFFEELESTNDYAKKYNPAGDTIVITSSQTKGKGRFNRKWISYPSKDLTFSIIKDFKIGIDEIQSVNFYTSYIIITTLKELYGTSVQHDFSLKWPNDILLNGKKIAGLLLDVKDLNSSIKKIIIGVGININSEKFSDEIINKASSLSKETGAGSDPEEILILLVKNFYGNIDLIQKRETLMNKWKEHTEILGKRICFKKADDYSEQSVTAIDIDNDGGLIIRSDEGKIMKYYSGEISLSYKF